MKTFNFPVSPALRKALVEIERAGIDDYRVENGGHVVLISRPSCSMEFWPARGKWREKGSGNVIHHSGVFAMLKAIRSRDAELRRKIEKEKPRIRKIEGGRWACTGRGVTGRADSFRKSFEVWEIVAGINEKRWRP